MDTQNGIVSKLWEAVRSDFAHTFPPDIYRSWFEPLYVVSETDDSIVFGVVNDFTAIWLQENYIDVLSKRLLLEAGRPIAVSFQVQARHDNVPHQTTTSIRASVQRRQESAQERTAIHLNKQNTFDNFVVGSGNQMAHAACMAVANMPGRAYNPLFIYGDTGLGKTHLMQAVAHHVLSQSKKANVVYTSTERFTNEFIAELQKNNLGEFRKKYRNVDVLLIDDIQFIIGKESTQEEFFHTFNNIYEAGHQIVITSDRPPIEMSLLDDRLMSRFQGGLMADIQPPDIETRMVITRAKAAQLGLVLEDDAVTYIAETITSNVRQIEGVIKRLTAYREILDSRIDTAAVKRAIKDVVRIGTFIPSPQLIIRESARYFSLNEEDLRGQNRSKNTATARQISMYLIRTLTNLPLKEIGAEYEDRNHSTVLSSIRKVEELIKDDPKFAATVRDITSNINSV